MEYSIQNRERVEKIALLMSLTLLAPIGVLLVLIAVTLLLGGAIESFHFILFLSLLPTTYYYYSRYFQIELSVEQSKTPVLILVLIVFCAFTLAGITYDHSSDGQTAHQEDIVHLSNGWNYIYDKNAHDFVKNMPASYPLKDVAYKPYSEWFAAKGTYVVAAAAYKFFGHIEYGKGFSFLLMCAAFLSVVAACLKLGMSVKISSFFAALIALNPIVIVQLTTFYVDGQNASLISIFIALTTYLLASRNIPKEILFAWALTLVILFNIKLTNIFFAGYFGLAGSAYLYWRKRSLLPFGYFIGACVVGLIIVGANPYIVNLPTYVDVLLNATREQMGNLTWAGGDGFTLKYNQFVKFFLSVFSSTDLNPVDVTLKIPFIVEPREYLAFREAHPDLRIAAFGPLYSGTFVLAILIILSSFINKSKYRFVNLVAILVVFGSVVSYPESWWFRFVPHAWLLPIIPAIYGYHFNKTYLFKFAMAILILLAVNIVLILSNYVYGEYLVQSTLKDRYELVKSMKQPVNVYYSNFLTNRLRFDDYDIDVLETPIEQCQNYIAMMPGGVRVCLGSTNHSYNHILRDVCSIEKKLTDNNIRFWIISLTVDNKNYAGCGSIQKLMQGK